MAERKFVNFRRISNAVSQASKVKVDQILGRRRDSSVTAPRMALIRIASSAGATTHAIGRFLGRNHSTVLSSLLNSQRYIDEGNKTGIAVARIEAVARELMAAHPPHIMVRPHVGADAPEVVPKHWRYDPSEDPVPLVRFRSRHGFVGARGEIVCDP